MSVETALPIEFSDAAAAKVKALVSEEETISSLERMSRLDDAVFQPYAVYDTSYLEPKDIVNFKLKNGRNLDRKTLNLIRNKEISAIIN